jgi:hypothetical protein
MKPKPPFDGMPPRIYLSENFDGDLEWSSCQTAFRQNIEYVRADLHRKAKAEITRLKRQIKDIVDDAPLPPVRPRRRTGK